MGAATLGEKIRAARKNKDGMSVAELARRLGVSRPSIDAWENDESYPRRDKIPKLVEVLGVSAADLNPYVDGVSVSAATDIIDRLRGHKELVRPGAADDMEEAAKEIEGLRRQVDKLLSALDGVSRQTAELVKANRRRS